MTNKSKIFLSVVSSTLFLLSSLTLSSSGQVIKQYHFDFAVGSCDITSTSVIDYSPISQNGFDFTAIFDDAGTMMHSYDLSTPPNIFQTINISDYGAWYTVLSDAQISNNMLSLIDTTNFSPWTNRPVPNGLPNDQLFTWYIQDFQHIEQFLDNQLSSFFNVTVYSEAVQTDNAFYWTKNGQEFSDRIVGWGYLNGESTPIPAPTTILLLGSGLLGLAGLRRKFKE